MKNKKNVFQTFGYLAIPQLFSEAETELIIDGFEWSIQNRGGGEEQMVPVAPSFGGPIEHSPKMCALLDYPAVKGLIVDVLGEVFNYCSGDGNDYTGDTNWHPGGNWG